MRDILELLFCPQHSILWGTLGQGCGAQTVQWLIGLYYDIRFRLRGE